MPWLNVPGDLETQYTKHHCSDFPGPTSELEDTGLVSFQFLMTNGCQTKSAKGSQVERPAFPPNQLVS